MQKKKKKMKRKKKEIFFSIRQKILFGFFKRNLFVINFQKFSLNLKNSFEF